VPPRLTWAQGYDRFARALDGGRGPDYSANAPRARPWDGSLHIVLDPGLAGAAVTAGWAEVHPVALAGLAARNRVMLYGPRNEAEVDIIFSLIAAAVRRAAGHQAQQAARP
jgi:hypothetical protein